MKKIIKVSVMFFSGDLIEDLDIQVDAIIGGLNIGNDCRDGDLGMIRDCIYDNFDDVKAEGECVIEFVLGYFNNYNKTTNSYDEGFNIISHEVIDHNK